MLQGKLTRKERRREEGRELSKGPQVGETGLWDNYKFSMPGKGLGGTLDCRRGPNRKLLGTNSENESPRKWSLGRVIGVLGYRGQV